MSKLDAVEVLYQHLSLQGSLVESTQSKTVRFAFLEGEDGNFKTFHPLVKCRDYLSDVLHYKPTTTTIGIYGFHLTSSENHLDLSCCRLLVEVPEEHAPYFVRNFEFIQRFEQENFEIPPAKLFAVKDSKNRFVIEADKFWLNCTQLVSLLTFLCRASLYLESPQQDWIEGLSKFPTSVDGQYLKRLVDWKIDYQIPFFAKLDYTKSPSASGYELGCSVSKVHDFGGILTFAQRGWHWEQDDFNRHTYPQYSKEFAFIRENELVKQMTELCGI